MKKMLAIVVLAIVCSLAAVAQDAKTSAKASIKTEVKKTVLYGYVVDAMCAKGIARKSETVMKRAASHTRSCGLDEACAASGFGVFSEGKWYKFDEAGDKQALELVRNSKKAKGLSVIVSGKQDGELFAVTTIAEHEMDGVGTTKDMKMEKKTETKSEEHQH